MKGKKICTGKAEKRWIDGKGMWYACDKCRKVPRRYGENELKRHYEVKEPKK